MNTSHNWHNLSHYGLRGHAQHAREMRQRHLMERLGAALVMFLAVLALIAAWPAHADAPRYQLDLMVYSTSTGHGLSLGTYLASFRVPVASTDDCENKGEAAIATFSGNVLPGGARTLPAYACETVR